MSPPRANASSAMTPRASLWMTWPVMPRVPGGPPGRRWPTPTRITWIGTGLLSPGRLPTAPVAAAGLRADGRLGAARLCGAGEVVLSGEPGLVRLEDRRELAEPDPGQRSEPDDLGREHEE